MARSKQLTMRALLERIEPVFAKADECVRHLNSIRYPMRDLLFLGLAIFTTKLPSLRRFERDLNGEPRLAENLRRLYKVGGLPTDEAIRQRLDRLDPKQLEDGYRMLFRQAGRARLLKRFKTGSGHVILALDGTGIYHSGKVHCPTCLTRTTRKGDTHYAHQMVLGAIVHPDLQQVLVPTMPEFVSKGDEGRNDGEFNAAQRYLRRFRREYPHLKTVVVMDALYLNTTMVNLLCDLRLDFVIVAQEGNAPTPFRDFRRYRKDCFSDASTSGRDRERVVEYARRVRLVQEQSTSRWNMVCTEERPPGKRCGGSSQGLAMGVRE